jgi:hypothetical protein
MICNIFSIHFSNEREEREREKYLSRGESKIEACRCKRRERDFAVIEREE